MRDIYMQIVKLQLLYYAYQQFLFQNCSSFINNKHFYMLNYNINNKIKLGLLLDHIIFLMFFLSNMILNKVILFFINNFDLQIN